ncbi:MAG: DUF1501 domain-containing protein [Planctomycetota bacterium]|nr:DUF1501 domain-containing protein [Planctomycetota bacterium]MED5398962.1 DUF1501 domain-containing protein [Planctomycetota bacterium]MEE3366691.1 DUF1501 domain-containing protein [Planctomycetota bacterium]
MTIGPVDPRRCFGTLPRRALVQMGLSGLGSLALPDLLRLESEAASRTGQSLDGKSIIVLWLWGGASHMETFDLKPEGPLGFRGEFRPIPTSAPGLDISEHLPKLAAHGDKLAIIRSLHHNSPGHVDSTHTVMTGYPGKDAPPPYRPDYPDFWAVASKVCGERVSGVPSHMALPRVRFNGSAYLGAGLEPFRIRSDPNARNFEVPNLQLDSQMIGRLRERRSLLKGFDGLRNDIDQSGVMDSLDIYNHKAVELLTSGSVRAAFDLGREKPEVRDRFGRHAVGQRCLLARRLVEAGVRLVTIDFPCVPGQKAFSWDDHASVWNIFEQMKIRLPVLDQVTSALIEDLHARGMQDDVLFVVMGEMSHTPRVHYVNGNPGREHWARAMSVLLSGGGMTMGQPVGATNNRGSLPLHRPLVPGDLLATLYQYLGVPLDTQFNDHAGRPTPILPEGAPIDELI